MINPKEEIENDKRLTALMNGLRSTWGFGDEFLAIVLWHTDDFDLANKVIELYMAKDEVDLEEILYLCLSREEFKEKCLNSDFLNYKICKKLFHDED
jgi:hypothetical protein|tara:strand:- start:6013 stop:6303 length:291 start_codon:yes stop_codon:yes gene_type:complete